jgi:hypothetical protein
VRNILSSVVPNRHRIVKGVIPMYFGFGSDEGTP